MVSVEGAAPLSFACVFEGSTDVHLCVSDGRGSEKGSELPGVCGGLCPGSQEPCWYVDTDLSRDVPNSASAKD